MKVVIALFLFYSALYTDARAQVSRSDTTSSRLGGASTTHIGIGLQTFPLPGISIKARLGKGFSAHVGALPSRPGFVPGEAFVGARLIREVYRLSMTRFFISGGYALNLLMEAAGDNADESTNQYGFGSAGAEWISKSGFGLSIETVVSIMGPQKFNSRLLPAGLGAGLHYYF